jgi:HK97 family phage portal protein
MFLAASGDDVYGRGPLDDFWYQPVNGRSAAGVRVTGETAMRLTTLYACVRNISEDIGKLPLPMYRRGANDSRQRETNHPIAKLLMRPNPAQTGNEWREMGQSHIELRGNFYNEIMYKGSRIVALRPLHPDYVTPELLPDYSLRYRVRDPRAGTDRTLLQDEVLHIKSMCTNGPVGLNPIEANREQLGEAIATQEYSAAFWRNDARPGIWLKHPGAFKDPNQREQFLARFNQKFSGQGRGGVFMSEHDIELKELTVKNTDAQFLESRMLQREQIAAMFRVPPHKVGIMDKATFSNIEQQAIEYVVDCLLGRCRRWEERLAVQLLSEAEQEEFYFEFLLAELLRGETKARFEAYGLGINAGWLLRSEPRKMENLDPIPGLERPLLPLNTVQLDAQGNPPPAPTPMKFPGSEPAAPPKPGKSTRESQLARAAADRVIRKEVAAVGKLYDANVSSEIGFVGKMQEFYGTHAAYVADVMAMPAAAAQAYVDSQVKELLAAVAIEVLTRQERVKLALMSWQPARAEELAALSAGE